MTSTLAGPAIPAGVEAVILVEDETVTEVALVPLNLTVIPLTKSVPVIATVVPPDVDPVLGVMLLIVGAG
jgi:hypothetical protein